MKTILPLCTNEGSGMGSSERDVKKYANGADVVKGLAIVCFAYKVVLIRIMKEVLKDDS